MLALTSKQQFDLLDEVIKNPYEGSEAISALLLEKWRDKNLADKMRSSIFSFTKEECLAWLANIDIKKFASTEKSPSDGLYAISKEDGWHVYLQERGIEISEASKLSSDEAKLRAFIHSFNFTTGGYLTKLFNIERALS